MVVAVIAFTWGFFSHRSNLFPYPLIRAAGLWVGLIHGPVPKRMDTSRRPVPLEELLTLPYLSGEPDTAGGKRGVVQHDPERAFAGWNLYNSLRENQAFLLTMDGDLVHRWSTDTGPYHHVELLPNGDLIAMIKDKKLIRMAKDSRILWEFEALVHHDTWVDRSSGDILVLISRPRRIPARHKTIPIMVDLVTVLSEDGRVKYEVDLFKAIESSPYAYLIPDVKGIRRKVEGVKAFDVLHTNHVEMIESDSAKMPDVFKAGNLLVSIRNLNSIVVVDPERVEVVWLWGPNNLIRQHHSVLLPSGNIMVFDNGISQSRVLEIDPAAGNEIVWQYGPREDFFSVVRGSNQRLANGNTLITESVTGRAFEVTPSGEIVWEFFNHDLDREGIRGSIWRVTRVNPEDYPVF